MRKNEIDLSQFSEVVSFYLAGSSILETCERFGLTGPQVWERLANEGWDKVRATRYAAAKRNRKRGDQEWAKRWGLTQIQRKRVSSRSEKEKSNKWALQQAAKEIHEMERRNEWKRLFSRKSYLDQVLSGLNREERFRENGRIFNRLLELGFELEVYRAKKVPKNAWIYYVDQFPNGSEFGIHWQDSTFKIWQGWLKRERPLEENEWLFEKDRKENQNGLAKRNRKRKR